MGSMGELEVERAKMDERETADGEEAEDVPHPQPYLRMTELKHSWQMLLCLPTKILVAP